MTADSAVPPTTDSDETIKRRICGALISGKTGFTFGDKNAWEAARLLAPLVAAEVAAALEQRAQAIEAEAGPPFVHKADLSDYTRGHSQGRQDGLRIAARIVRGGSQP